MPKNPLPASTIEARVLNAVASAQGGWLNRHDLNKKSGFTKLSGSATRALNGVKKNKYFPAGRPGLIQEKAIEVSRDDVDGKVEINYKVTPVGRTLLKTWLKEHDGKVPKLRGADTSTNKRYLGETKPAKANGKPAKKSSKKPQAKKIKPVKVKAEKAPAKTKPAKKATKAKTPKVSRPLSPAAALAARQREALKATAPQAPVNAAPEAPVAASA